MYNTHVNIINAKIANLSNVFNGNKVLAYKNKDLPQFLF